MMYYTPGRLHTSNSMRLKGYDYTRKGRYFVTLVTKNRKPIFGRVKNELMELNEVGLIVQKSWQWLKDQYEYVSLDEFIIMPNHLHGIIVLHEEGCVSRNTSTDLAHKPKSLGRLIGAFKTVSTKQVNQLNSSPKKKMWQRDFHDQIIRGSEDLERIRRYIKDNPRAWDADVQ